MATAFQSDTFQNNAFQIEGGQAPVVTGGKGDNERRIYKPTGLLERNERKSVEDRVEDSRQIQAEVAGQLARELRGEIEAFEAFAKPVVRMSISEIDAEIGSLLRKRIRTEEDEIILLLLIAAAG